MYNKKLEDTLAHEQEMCKKELEELYAICENSVFFCCICVLWFYNLTYTLCIVVIFMMQKLTPMSVTVQSSTNKDAELSERVILDVASTKGSCSAAHTIPKMR